MLRKVLLCVLLVVLSVSALDAGASRYLLLGFAALAALGLFGSRGRPGG
jgi:hypothetical protein